MQTSTVLLVLVILTVIGYFMGQRRSHAVSSEHGGIKALHSLPRHYGYMTALWAIIPAMLMLVIWMGMEANIIKNIVLSSLPANVQQMPENQLGLYYNQIISFAQGSIDDLQLDSTQVAAAEQYNSLVASSKWMKAGLVLAMALIGGTIAMRRITHLLRARNNVE